MTSDGFLIVGVVGAIVNIGIAIHDRNWYAFIGWMCATVLGLGAILK